MIQFSNVVEIDRPTAEVFAYLANLEHIPEWNPAIERTQQVDGGPVAVGSRFRQVRSVPIASTEELTVTHLDPDRRLDVAGRIGPFEARLRYVLTPLGAGTRVTNDVELDPPLPIGPLEGIVGSRIRAAVLENLSSLKARLESGVPA